jgi:hypothetical protein
VDQATRTGGHSLQLSRDDAARFIASSLHAVLEKLGIQHTVEGITVLHAGDGVFLVDIVMRDIAAKDTWAVMLTIPPSKEEPDHG